MSKKTDILNICDNANITMQIDKNIDDNVNSEHQNTNESSNNSDNKSDNNSDNKSDNMGNLPCLDYINSVTLEIEDLSILLSYCPINETQKIISKLNIYQLLKLQIISPKLTSLISSHISNSSFDNIFPYIRDILFDIDSSCDNHHRYSLFVHLLQFIHIYQPHIFSIPSIHSILLLKLSELLPHCHISSPLHFFFNYLSSLSSV